MGGGKSSKYPNGWSRSSTPETDGSTSPTGWTVLPSPKNSNTKLGGKWFDAALSAPSPVPSPISSSVHKKNNNNKFAALDSDEDKSDCESVSSDRSDRSDRSVSSVRSVRSNNSNFSTTSRSGFATPSQKLSELLTNVTSDHKRNSAINEFISLLNGPDKSTAIRFNYNSKTQTYELVSVLALVQDVSQRVQIIEKFIEGLDCNDYYNCKKFRSEIQAKLKGTELSSVEERKQYVKDICDNRCFLPRNFLKLPNHIFEKIEKAADPTCSNDTSNSISDILHKLVSDWIHSRLNDFSIINNIRTFWHINDNRINRSNRGSLLVALADIRDSTLLDYVWETYNPKATNNGVGQVYCQHPFAYGDVKLPTSLYLSSWLFCFLNTVNMSENEQDIILEEIRLSLKVLYKMGYGFQHEIFMASILDKPEYSDRFRFELYDIIMNQVDAGWDDLFNDSLNKLSNNNYKRRHHWIRIGITKNPEGSIVTLFRHILRFEVDTEFFGPLLDIIFNFESAEYSVFTRYYQDNSSVFINFNRNFITHSMSNIINLIEESISGFEQGKSSSIIKSHLNTAMYLYGKLYKLGYRDLVINAMEDIFLRSRTIQNTLTFNLSEFGASLEYFFKQVDIHVLKDLSEHPEVCNIILGIFDKLSSPGKESLFKRFRFMLETYFKFEPGTSLDINLIRDAMENQLKFKPITEDLANEKQSSDEDSSLENPFEWKDEYQFDEVEPIPQANEKVVDALKKLTTGIKEQLELEIDFSKRKFDETVTNEMSNTERKQILDDLQAEAFTTMKVEIVKMIAVFNDDLKKEFVNSEILAINFCYLLSENNRERFNAIRVALSHLDKTGELLRLVKSQNVLINFIAEEFPAFPKIISQL